VDELTEYLDRIADGRMQPTRINLPPYTANSVNPKKKRQYYRPGAGEEPPRYVAPDQLTEAVNLAMHLGRPLLLEGEPGCGKSSLARHVAWAVDAPYFEWYVKSTETARGGLYTFDSVGRLRDGQLRDADLKAKKRFANIDSYIKLGPLGAAFASVDRAAVVLIDEIDKADPDLPNDLLLELDRMSYVIPEKDPTTPVPAKERPLVLITSNRENPLPRAFLRRCLYHYIEFPNNEELKSILDVHGLKLDDAFIDAAIGRFVRLREDMRERQPRAEKVPDVAELLDWLRALGWKQITKSDQLPADRLPASHALLKTWADKRDFEPKK
jgi:MoxR-like ATPase